MLPEVLNPRVALLEADGEQPAGALLRPGGGPVEKTVALVSGEPGRPRVLHVLCVQTVDSRAFGLAHAASDVDRRGLFIASADLHGGLTRVPSSVSDDAEQVCLWEIGHAFRLGLAGNPTVLESLHSPLVDHACPLFEPSLRRLVGGGAFLSHRMLEALCAYVDRQRRKLDAKLERRGHVHWPHAMHLMRLLAVALRTAESGRFDVEVPPSERAWLLAIRAGRVELRQVLDEADRLRALFEEARAGSPLPERPDAAAVESELVRLRLWLARALDRPDEGGL